MTVEDVLELIYNQEINQFFLCVMVVDDYPYFYEVVRRQAYQVVAAFKKYVLVNVRVDGSALYIG